MQPTAEFWSALGFALVLFCGFFGIALMIYAGSFHGRYDRRREEE